MNNKLPDLMEHILDYHPDIVFLTETWMTSEKNNITADVKKYGFELVHKIRKDRFKERGGGVGTLIRNVFDCKPLPSKVYFSFEHNVSKFPLKNNQFLLLITVFVDRSQNVSP